MKIFELHAMCSGMFECGDCQGEEDHHLGTYSTKDAAEEAQKEWQVDLEGQPMPYQEYTILELEECQYCKMFVPNLEAHNKQQCC